MSKLGPMIADKGYAVVPGPFGSDELADILGAIDHAAARAEPHEIHRGSTGTNVRIEGLFDRVPALSRLFTFEPLLEAASTIIGCRFRLSAFHMRSVLGGAEAQALHQDVVPHGEAWPLVGFIFMLDEFHETNGATRFVPGTQECESLPKRGDAKEEHACGSRASMIIFHGSVWHGFAANLTGTARRSINGALIPAHSKACRDYRATLSTSVWDQLSQRAKDVIQGT